MVEDFAGHVCVQVPNERSCDDPRQRTKEPKNVEIQHANSTMWFSPKLLLIVLSIFNFMLGAKQNFEVHYLKDFIHFFWCFCPVGPHSLKKYC